MEKASGCFRGADRPDAALYEARILIMVWYLYVKFYFNRLAIPPLREDLQ
jgi:hypothetical protein